MSLTENFAWAAQALCARVFSKTESPLARLSRCKLHSKDSYVFTWFALQLIEGGMSTTTVAPIKQFLMNEFNLTDFTTGDTDGSDNTLVCLNRV
jgi:hypothetical protein